MTLFVPNGQSGFVSASDGNLHLQRIIIPICARPSPHRAVDALVGLLKTCGVTGATVTLLYVGDESDMPMVAIPAPDSGFTFEHVVRSGDPVEQITQMATHLEADLVVMSTAGHDGFLDALRGSTTEQVLRKLSCPLLAVPANRPDRDE